MLAGGLSLWRSLNIKADKPSWSRIKSSTGSPISAVAVAVGNSDIIWVGHNNGLVYYTLNGTAMMSPVCFVRNDKEINTPAITIAGADDRHRSV